MSNEERVRRCKRDMDRLIERFKADGFGPKWIAATEARNIFQKHFISPTNNSFGYQGYARKEAK